MTSAGEGPRPEGPRKEGLRRKHVTERQQDKGKEEEDRVAGKPTTTAANWTSGTRATRCSAVLVGSSALLLRWLIWTTFVQACT